MNDQQKTVKAPLDFATKRLRSKDAFEIFGLGVFCLFVVYLLASEIEQQRKCIPDHIAQEQGNCR